MSTKKFPAMTGSSPKAILLCAIVLFLGSVVAANAACCSAAGPSDSPVCCDGTMGTPCCATGSCNIFCCNCDGQCRTGCICGNETSELSSESKVDLAKRFDQVDKDRDGRLSLKEVKTWVQAAKPNFSSENIKSEFAKMDLDSSGSIEKGEFDRDLKDSE